MRRKGIGGRGGGEELCSIIQVFEDGDCVLDGLEILINSDFCLLSRVFRYFVIMFLCLSFVFVNVKNIYFVV